MKCPCGYAGIPTRHDGGTDHWKCPACHAPRPLPLRHDWARDADHGGGPLPFACSQCGMRAGTDTEDRTPCPGGPGPPRAAHCVCGEWGPDPGPYPATLPCRRCGNPYPHYAPPEPPRRPRGALAGLTPDDVKALRELLKGGD